MLTSVTAKGDESALTRGLLFVSYQIELSYSNGDLYLVKYLTNINGN